MVDLPHQRTPPQNATANAIPPQLSPHQARRAWGLWTREPRFSYVGPTLDDPCAGSGRGDHWRASWRGKELLDRVDEVVGLILGDEGATAGDQLKTPLRQQLCQPSSVVAGEDLVIVGPQHQCGLVEAG